MNVIGGQRVLGCSLSNIEYGEIGIHPKYKRNSIKIADKELLSS